MVGVGLQRPVHIFHPPEFKKCDRVSSLPKTETASPCNQELQRKGGRILRAFSLLARLGVCYFDISAGCRPVLALVDKRVEQAAVALQLVAQVHGLMVLEDRAAVRVGLLSFGISTKLQICQFNFFMRRVVRLVSVRLSAIILSI